MHVSDSSPLPLRLLAWAGERFPAVNGVFCLALYAAALACGRSAAAGAGPIALSPRDLVGFFAAYAFLLMLRVFDEHKDYELDCQNHPQRVLQRGLITLTHLKVLGAAAIALQLGVSLGLDGSLGLVTLRWLLVFAWSCLMGKEFFVHEWLSQRLVLYAVSHMIVMPMALLWMAQMGAGQAPLPHSAYFLAGLSMASGFTLEVGRKTWAPEQERPTVDSYSKVLGLRGAVAVLLVLSLATGTLLVLTLGRPSPAALIVAAVAVLLPAPQLLRFLRAPSPKGAKLNEAVLGMQALAAYVLLTGTWLSQRGVTWR